MSLSKNVVYNTHANAVPVGRQFILVRQPRRGKHFFSLTPKSARSSRLQFRPGRTTPGILRSSVSCSQCILRIPTSTIRKRLTVAAASLMSSPCTIPYFPVQENNNDHAYVRGRAIPRSALSTVTVLTYESRTQARSLLK